MALSVDRPLAAIGAEHHRPVIGGFSHDRDRPGRRRSVARQVGQQFYHGPAADHGGGQRLDTGVAVGQPGLVVTYKLPQLPVTADLPGAGVVNNHLAGPYSLQGVRVTLVECI